VVKDELILLLPITDFLTGKEGMVFGNGAFGVFFE
jgi:hypothetical protein